MRDISAYVNGVEYVRTMGQGNQMGSREWANKGEYTQKWETNNPHKTVGQLGDAGASKL